MPSNLECPYCSSYESTLISNFHSAVLDAKTSVYQCGQCLNLFDFPRNVKKSELQERLSDLQQDAGERTAVAVAANSIGILSNPELGATITEIQHNSLTAQLDLIGQEIATANPANSELLDELRRQEFDTQVKLVEVQKQELKKRLSDLQDEVEERISIAVASELSIDPGNELQVLVIIYAYDSLNNCVPVDSSWATPSDFRPSNFEPETRTNLNALTTAADSSVSHLLRLLFGVFQIIFGIWLFFVFNF